MNHKCLILGASGFIGGYLFQKFSKHMLTIGTYNSNNSNNLIKFDFETDDIKDILNKYFDKNHKKIAIISSAISQIDRCKIEKEKTYYINVIKTKEVIKKLYEYNFKVIFLSTDYVFDGKKGFYSEKDIPNPITEYGKQKYEIEQYIQKNYDDYLIFRLSPIVSVSLKDKHIFSNWFKIAQEKKELVSIKNNNFNVTLIDDVEKIIFLSYINNLNGLYHLSSNNIFNRYELSIKFLKYIGVNNVTCYEKSLEDFNFTDTRVLNSTLNNNKIKNIFGDIFTDVDKMLRNKKEENYEKL